MANDDPDFDDPTLAEDDDDLDDDLDDLGEDHRGDLPGYDLDEQAAIELKETADEELSSVHGEHWNFGHRLHRR